MKNFLIGLGNPGVKYASTRHNAGRMFAAWLKDEGRRTKDESGVTPEGFKIVETDCFMNESGEWIKNKMAGTAGMARTVKSFNHFNRSEFNRSTVQPFNRFDHLFIAHDDLDLPLGSFKIQFGRGPRLHKGILSIEKALETKDFWRVRIGVDNRLSVAVAKPVSSGGSGSETSIDRRLSVVAAKPVSASGSDRRDRLTIPVSQTQPSNDSDTSLANATVKRLPKLVSQTQPPAGTINRPSGEEYVLRPFRREEKIILKQTFNLIKQAIAEQFTKSFRSDVCNKLIK